MANTQNGISNKQEVLVELINNLKQDIKAEKEKLRIIENEEKVHICLRNNLEVRKDTLSRSIAFYEKYLKKVNTKLDLRLIHQEKYTLLNEGYDKILKTCREKYLTEKNKPEPNTDGCNKDLSLETKKKINDLLREKEKVRTIIRENSNTIKNLINVLEQE